MCHKDPTVAPAWTAPKSPDEPGPLRLDDVWGPNGVLPTSDRVPAPYYRPLEHAGAGVPPKVRASLLLALGWGLVVSLMPLPWVAELILRPAGYVAGLVLGIRGRGRGLGPARARPRGAGDHLQRHQPGLGRLWHWLLVSRRLRGADRTAPNSGRSWGSLTAISSGLRIASMRALGEVASGERSRPHVAGPGWGRCRSRWCRARPRTERRARHREPPTDRACC